MIQAKASTKTHSQAAHPLLVQLQKELETKDFTLPSLPDSVIKLKKALENPQVSHQTLSKLLTTDPALVGRLMQAANSPMFRGLNKISDLQMAVGRLGLTCVQNLVISLTLAGLYQGQGQGQSWVQQKLKETWNQSIKVAAVSEALSHRIRSLESSEALLAGLTFDIGAVPIIQLCARKFGKPKDENVLNTAIYKLSPTVSRWILEHWHINEHISTIPTLITDLSRQHNKPPDYTDIVQIARLHVFRNKPHPLGQINWLKVPAFSKLGLSPEDSIDAIREARESIQAVMQMLQY